MPISHVKLVIRQLLLREWTLRAVAMLFSTNAPNTGRHRFSGVLLGVGRQLVTVVSGQPIGPIFKLLKTKRRLLYLKTQSVPRSKHFSSRLYKPVYAVSGTSSCLFSDKYKAHKYSVDTAYNSWMLNLLVHHVTSRLEKVRGPAVQEQPR
jgi:hypothetical protein